MKTRSTVMHVAERAGVGASTVSRYLRGIQVRPKHAERIAKAVKELGYEPDEAARTLRGGRSHTIGVIFPKVSNIFFSQALQLMEEIARQRNHTLLLLTHNDSLSEQAKHLTTLRRSRAEGVIITGAPGTTLRDVRTFLPNQPVVAFDSFFSPEFDSILLQNREAARTATEHFIEHGYRDIACVSAKPEIFSYSERIAGYSDTMSAHGLKSRLIADQDYASLCGHLKAEMSRKSAPEALLALSDTAAYHVLTTFEELKLSPSNRPALIAFDEFDFAPLLSTPLSVIRQPIADMVQNAMSALFRQIEGFAPSYTQTLLLPAELVLRRSCGCQSPSHPTST